MCNFCACKYLLASSTNTVSHYKCSVFKPSICMCVCYHMIIPVCLFVRDVMGLYLITGGAARLQPLSMVPAAVDLPVLVEVDEVHQELIAHAAHEAGWVPAHAVTCS